MEIKAKCVAQQVLCSALFLDEAISEMNQFMNKLVKSCQLISCFDITYFVWSDLISRQIERP